MKSNLELQRMLASVLSNISGIDTREDSHKITSPVHSANETSNAEAGMHTKGDICSGGMGSSEQWWDDVCATSDDWNNTKEYPKKVSWKKTMSEMKVTSLMYKIIILNSFSECGGDVTA